MRLIIMKKCEQCGQTKGVIMFNRKLGQELCERHNKQVSRHGYIKCIRRFKKNEVVIYDNYFEMLIKDKDDVELYKVLVDIVFLEKTMKYRWCCVNTTKIPLTYAYISGKNVQLFSYLFGKDKVTSKFGKNYLDFREKSLILLNNDKSRFLVRTKNKRNNSGTVGVSYYKKTNSWRAIININRERIFIGDFKNKQDAIDARERFELNYGVVIRV